MSAVTTFSRWVKTNDNPLAVAARKTYYASNNLQMPAPRLIYGPISVLFFTARFIVRRTLRIALWTPMFKTRLQNVGKNLFLYGGLPMVTGPIKIEIGSNCRISGQSTISGRWFGESDPELSIGDNVDIGWRTTIAVGTRVHIGNNVRIAERGFLAGYPGHPLNAQHRAAGKADTEDQVGDIVLEADVWLASGVTVLKGVTIGQGTVVGAGSVVSKSLPAGVVAAGVPARVIREIDSRALKVVS